MSLSKYTPPFLYQIVAKAGGGGDLHDIHGTYFFCCSAFSSKTTTVEWFVNEVWWNRHDMILVCIWECRVEVKNWLFGLIMLLLSSLTTLVYYFNLDICAFWRLLSILYLCAHTGDNSRKYLKSANPRKLLSPECAAHSGDNSIYWQNRGLGVHKFLWKLRGLFSKGICSAAAEDRRHGA